MDLMSIIFGRNVKIFGRKNKHISKEDLDALSKFIMQIYWGDGLTEEQSENNLDESLVELTRYGNHSSNGLLITDNGYFLTDKHCVADGEDIGIRLQDGSQYDLERVCTWSKDYDIALAKANIPGEPKPRRYRIKNTNNLEKSHVALKTRRDSNLIIKYGYINEAGMDYETHDEENPIMKNQFITDIHIISGDSGSIVISQDRRLIGFINSLMDYTYFSYSTGTKIITALELIDYYVRHHQKNVS